MEQLGAERGGRVQLGVAPREPGGGRADRVLRLEPGAVHHGSRRELLGGGGHLGSVDADREDDLRLHGSHDVCADGVAFVYAHDKTDFRADWSSIISADGIADSSAICSPKCGAVCSSISWANSSSICHTDIDTNLRTDSSTYSSTYIWTNTAAVFAADASTLFAANSSSHLCSYGSS